MTSFSQDGFAYRFDWGVSGAGALVPSAGAVVVVDVLSFTTCVDVALGQGAIVLPYRWNNGTEEAFAAEHGAELAVPRREVDDTHPWSLSPTRLSQIPAGTRLVLPSPNGAALAFGAAAAGTRTVMAACLRNASAVAQVISQSPDAPGVVAVIAAGERWKSTTGPLRPAVEDLLGAGAVIAALAPYTDDSLSPEASVAAAAWAAHADDLELILLRTGSGRELAGAGYGPDVLLAAEVDVSRIAPVLTGPAFVDGNPAR